MVTLLKVLVIGIVGFIIGAAAATLAFLREIWK